MGQSVGVGGGSIKLVKRKRETLEGTCVGNSNEEVSFGEENWEVISGDTLGDDEGCGPVVMTTLGSWMAWRSLAR